MSTTDQPIIPPSTGSAHRGKGEPIVRLEGVSKKYRKGKRDIDALMKISLSIYEGELITIQGPSGCGKTTLLNMISMMDSPSTGSVYIKGQKVVELKDDEKSEIIANNIGFVFQSYNLVDQYTALENVSIAPGAKKIKSDKVRKEMAIKALEKVGLKDRMDNNPGELSGGEQQRVTIARAIVNDPAILIADEPTGDLDSESGQKIMELFKELNEKDGRTILIVTHDHAIGAAGKRRIKMRDYKIVSDEGGTGPVAYSSTNEPPSNTDLSSVKTKEELVGAIRREFIDNEDYPKKVRSSYKGLVKDMKSLSFDEAMNKFEAHVKNQPIPDQEVVDKSTEKERAAEEKERKKAAEETSRVKAAEEFKARRKAEEEKMRKDAEETSRKAAEVQIAKIKELIDVSERIKIQDIADILNISRKDVIQKIVPLAKNLNVQISGDFLNVSKDSTNAFVDEIEKQFGKWGRDNKI